MFIDKIVFRIVMAWSARSSFFCLGLNPPQADKSTRGEAMVFYLRGGGSSPAHINAPFSF
ncbi:hypothetical protein ACFLQL_03725 [Verrucomicrobiota bacterium]